MGVVFLSIEAKYNAQNLNIAFEKLQSTLNLMCDDAELDDYLWEDYTDTPELYMASFKFDLETLDSQPNVLGVLYDKNMTQISEREIEIGIAKEKQYLFDPLSSALFKASVKKNERGELIVPGERGDVLLYFRWFMGGDYLAVIGTDENGAQKIPRAMSVCYLALLTWSAFVPILDIIKEKGERK